MSSELPAREKGPKNDLELLIFPTLTPKFRDCRHSPLCSVCAPMKNQPRALCMLAKCTANLAAAQFSVSVAFLVAKNQVFDKKRLKGKGLV